MLQPTRTLLMNAAGHLFVQEEIEDLTTITEYQELLESATNSRGGIGTGGEYDGMEGF